MLVSDVCFVHSLFPPTAGFMTCYKQTRVVSSGSSRNIFPLRCKVFTTATSGLAFTRWKVTSAYISVYLPLSNVVHNMTGRWKTLDSVPIYKQPQLCSVQSPVKCLREELKLWSLTETENIWWDMELLCVWPELLASAACINMSN